MKVLHVIPALGPGGPARSLAVLVGESAARRPDMDHAALVLRGRPYMPLRLRLKRAGCRVIGGGGTAEAEGAVAEADVVLLHFWNTPVLWDWLAGPLPGARFVLWSKIEGSHAPQRLSAGIVGAAHGCVFTAAPPAHLAELAAQAPVVPGLVEFERLHGLERRPHDGFHADYLGTLTGGKLHPAFFEMMDRVDIPDLRVRVCGGALEPAFARSLGRTRNRDRFEFPGFVENIARVLETSDVLAYPLAPATYASSDKALQEAMLAGVVPVILPHGGPARFVRDGETGIVAADEDAFVAAVESLHRDPGRRAEMGCAARAFAEDAFAPGPHVSRMIGVLEEAARGERRPLFADPAERAALRACPPAARFLVSQGWAAQEALGAARDCLAGRDRRMMDFAAGAGADLFRLEGGILHWRNTHREDPVLRCWAGIWLDREGDPSGAAGEFAAAGALGAPADAIAAARGRGGPPP